MIKIDNKNVKDLEIAMKMPNVEEMPIHHTTWCKKGDEEIILEYWNYAPLYSNVYWIIGWIAGKLKPKSWWLNVC